MAKLKQILTESNVHNAIHLLVYYLSRVYLGTASNLILTDCKAHVYKFTEEETHCHCRS